MVGTHRLEADSGKGESWAPGVKFHSTDLERAVTYFAKGTSSASSVTLISGILGPGQETFRYLEVQEWGVQCPVSVALAARETSGSELANQLHPPWHVAASNWEWRKQMARQGAKAITILLSFLPPLDSPSQPQPLRIRETAQSCLGHKCN